MAMIRQLNMFEFTFDRKKAYLDRKGIKTDELTNSEIEDEFLKLTRIREKERKIAEEIEMANEAKQTTTLKDLIKDLGQGKSKVYSVDDLKIKVQVKIVGKIENKEVKK